MHRRTSIYLDDSAMKALKLLAVASGTTVSEKIREAVDTMLAAQVGQVDWSSEIEGILERARSRDLPELSGEEMMAEVKAVRANRRKQPAEKKRHARA
jgi:Arc/MetJ-type ribon-helix-helix transcriptional regulator